MVNELLKLASSDAGKMVFGLVGVLVFVVVNALMLTWAERKIAGHMQRRIGPKEVGPFGLIQPIADALKLLGKEILTPAKVDKPLYYLAPTLIFVPVLVSFIVIPFDASLQVTDINVGILVILAFSSITILSILMAGWGSENKYSLIGAIRSVAQNIAYEIPMLLALLPVIMLANSLSLKEIVEKQQSLWFVVVQPLAFIIYFIAGVAETNRTPFDLPEAESELVAGYHTEY
jgi:NADH-quinone oxidoreductase subunit H